MSSLHIAISAEPVITSLPVVITNSMFSSVIVSAFLILVAIIVRVQLQPSQRVPSGLQNAVEFMIESLYSLVEGITGSVQKTAQFFPLFATFFLFILINNWFGLLPGNHTIALTSPIGTPVETHAAETHSTEAPAAETHSTETPAVDSHATDETHAAVAPTTTSTEPIEIETAERAIEVEHAPIPLFRGGTADINTTLALALITVTAIQFFGIKYLGLSYFSKFINFSGPMAFFVGILELVSELSRVISFAFRLFGNIFAGEVLILVISYLVPVIVPMPFYGLEIFVGLIQAMVFGMLSLVLYNMATVGHSAEH